MRIDTHCHTNCSDGAVTIEERIAMVKASHYDAATITDHDFISAEMVKRAREACDGMPFIPGIELSLRNEGQVVHLLGYFIDPASPDLLAHIEQVDLYDQACTLALLRYFQDRGVQLSMEDLVSDSLHTFYSLALIKRISRDLYENDSLRYMPAFMEAMQVIGIPYPDFAPWDVHNAIDIIHKAGGMAVLAHPGGENAPSMQTLGFLLHKQEHLRKYTDWGLDGIEAVTPVHTPQEIAFYKSCAKDMGLFITAGSDCHGEDPFLGPATMGKSIEIPENSYENLIQAYQTWKSKQK